MLSQDLSCNTYALIKDLLPNDPFYSAVLQCGGELQRPILDLKILESASLVASLSRREIICYNKPEYLHLLTVVEAVWCSRKEADIKKIIHESAENELKLTDAALSIFAYKLRWTNVEQAEVFLNRPLIQNELERLAYAAGAAGNKELLANLRNLDKHLLNNAYEGAICYGKKSAIKTVQKLGLDLVEYKQVLSTPAKSYRPLLNYEDFLALIKDCVAQRHKVTSIEVTTYNEDREEIRLV